MPVIPLLHNQQWSTFISKSLIVMQVAQGQRIRAKKEKNATKPVMGQLMSCKMKNMEKCTLSETVGGIKPGGYTKQQVEI